MKNIYIVYGENFEAINDFEKKVAQNYLKTLDFVEIAEKASLNTSFTDEVLKEDEDGIPITYKDAILELSAKTKKTATKKFYEKYAKTHTLEMMLG